MPDPIEDTKAATAATLRAHGMDLLGQWTDRQIRLIGQAHRAAIEGPPRTIPDEDARRMVDVFVAAILEVAPDRDPAEVRAVISSELRQHAIAANRVA